MNKKVDFFLIGAPKCGTTSLSAYLSEHKNICFSNPKEPCYFATDIFTNKRLQSTNDYLKCFSRNNKHIVAGEGSVTYLFSQVAIKKILAYNPDAKFIIMLRNPVDMTYSWHAQKCFEHQEDVIDFEKAWFLQDKRKKGKAIPEYCTIPQYLQYKEWGLFGKQISVLFDKVNPDNCFIIIFEEFIKNNKKIYKELLFFLGVTDDCRKDFKKYNENKVVKNYKIDQLRIKLTRICQENTIVAVLYKIFLKTLGLRRLGLQKLLISLNYSEGKRKPLSQNFRNLLLNEFKDDIKVLEKILNRDLSSQWK